jgi:hypothetical protein
MGMDTAAAAKNLSGSRFFSRVVNGMTERGRGRVRVPVDVMVSVLDNILVGMQVWMDGNLPEMIT